MVLVVVGVVRFVVLVIADRFVVLVSSGLWWVCTAARDDWRGPHCHFHDLRTLVVAEYAVECGDGDGEVAACGYDEEGVVVHAVASVLVFQEVVASWDTLPWEDNRTWATWGQQKHQGVPDLLPDAELPPLLLLSASPWGCTAATGDIHEADEAEVVPVERVANLAVPVVVAAVAAATERSTADAISEYFDVVAARTLLPRVPRKSVAEEVRDPLEWEAQVPRTGTPRLEPPQVGYSLACFPHTPPTPTNVLKSLDSRQEPRRFDYLQRHEYRLPVLEVP